MKIESDLKKKFLPLEKMPRWIAPIVTSNHTWLQGKQGFYP